MTDLAESGFRSVHSTSFAALLAGLGGTLAVTTYQSGRLILLRQGEGRVNTHFRRFPVPMGLAWRGRDLALGTARDVRFFRDVPQASGMSGGDPAADACYLPARSQITGDVRIHEMAWVGEELWFANTRFSCLARLAPGCSFEPLWRPRFVSALAAEDRCHLNGMCVDGGQVRYVSALGTADTPGGWRERKADGGALVDVASGECVATGLSMPHSPRLYHGRLWVLESGKGTLAQIDPRDGRVETVCELPGFTRGLAFAGPYAFVGLSQVRESVFDGIPLSQRVSERVCGVWAVDLRSGRIVALLRFEGQVQELFDVQWLPHRHPDLLEDDDPRVANAFVLPDATLAARDGPPPA
jgi:uncharacterized protein (TIGR03032 family)